MISKELFLKFIKEYQAFNDAIGRIETALSGRHNGCNLYDSDWHNSVGLMLDIFLESHFTDDGQDLINYYLFEDCEHIIYEKEDKNLFNQNETEIEYHLNTIEDVWNYITNEKRIKDYVKEINN